MILENDKLYTFLEILNYLRTNRKGEIRLFLNVPGRKKERALMFDDGEKYYSINETEHTLKNGDRPVTKCIFNEGYVIPIIKLIDDGHINP